MFLLNQLMVAQTYSVSSQYYIIFFVAVETVELSSQLVSSVLLETVFCRLAEYLFWTLLVSTVT